MSIRFMPLLWRHSILSCSNDDSITQMEISENQFVGEWCLVAFRSFQETEIVIDGEKFFTIDQSKGSDFDFILFFSEQPNKLISEGTYKVDNEFNLNGIISESSGTIDSQTSNSLFEGDWKLEGNKIFITKRDFITTFNIVEFREGFIRLSMQDQPLEETNPNNPEFSGTRRIAKSENSIVLVR